MTITPAIKGQLTKAMNHTLSTSAYDRTAIRFTAMRLVFSKHMPRQQAKHAARKYLANVA